MGEALETESRESMDKEETQSVDTITSDNIYRGTAAIINRGRQDGGRIMQEESKVIIK